tara:strand:- start:234 stop:344 length:111 start_codon:yes stop_codon:yes gene_type:complete
MAKVKKAAEKAAEKTVKTTKKEVVKVTRGVFTKRGK